MYDIAVGYLITMLILANDTHFNHKQRLLTSSLHWWQHSKILKSPTNDAIFYFMTSLRIRRIDKS